MAHMQKFQSEKMMVNLCIDLTALQDAQVRCDSWVCREGISLVLMNPVKVTEEGISSFAQGLHREQGEWRKNFLSFFLCFSRVAHLIPSSPALRLGCTALVLLCVVFLGLDWKFTTCSHTSPPCRSQAVGFPGLHGCASQLCDYYREFALEKKLLEFWLNSLDQ